MGGGCLPQAAPPSSGETRASADAPDRAALAARPLNIAFTNEPTALVGKFARRSGFQDSSLLFGAQLVRPDYLGNPVPVLASEAPSLERGSWQVIDGNRMETIYPLRRSATWHDGTPLTADDVVFTWQAIMTPELGAIDQNPERLIERVEAPDPHTVMIRWREIYIHANTYELEPLPRHILEPLVGRDPQSFVNSPYWTNQLVGAGPYALTDWVPGSHLRGRAYDGYVLGRPKIDEIMVHFISDTNQAVARFLAGGIDLTVGSLIKVEEGVILRDQLQARGEGTVLTTPESTRVGDFQLRDPGAPQARSVLARRALSHALDRELLVDTLHYGLTLPAQTFIPPGDPSLGPATPPLTQYTFDRNRAGQLLHDAGWERRADGLLYGSSGDRFDLAVQTLEGAQYVKEAQVIVESWRNVGVNAELEVLPRSRQNDREYRAKFPGFAIRALQRGTEWTRKWRTEEIPLESNQWRGDNRGAYSRPDVDRASVEYLTTIDPARRIAILLDVLRTVGEDVPSLPLYHGVDVYAVRDGLRGVQPSGPGQGWTVFNAHELSWER
jgi:peptide/nickel transport system substrate-binding protein